MKLTDLTFEQFMGLVAALFALFIAVIGAYNAISTAMKNRAEKKREAASPITKLTERVDRHDELLAKDKDRLDKLDGEVKDLGEATRILLRQSLAVNAHMISGNDVSKLKASNAEIEQYLVNRK